MVIVLVTVCLFGGTTEILLDALRIDLGIDEDEYQRGEGRQSFGIIQTFEERFVFPWVLRDWGARGVSHNEGEKDMRLKMEKLKRLPAVQVELLGPNSLEMENYLLLLRE